MNKDNNYNMAGQKTLIAIDPGKAGAIAVLCGTEISTRSLKNLAEPNILEFLRSVSGPHSVAYLEKVGGYIPDKDGEGQPGSRMFVFGEAYGLVRGLLLALEIKTVFVLPQLWQRGIPGRGGSYSERKTALAAHARKLFPDLKFGREEADALGILHYARFREFGTNGGYDGEAPPVPVAKRELPPMREQFALAEAWCKRQGWPVPAKGTPERASMVDHWANLFLNAEVGP